MDPRNFPTIGVREDMPVYPGISGALEYFLHKGSDTGIGWFKQGSILTGHRGLKGGYNTHF